MWMLLADLHFDEKNLLDLAPTLEWIHKAFAQHRPTQVFLLGDSTNQRKKPGTETTSALASFIRGFVTAAWSPTVHCLIGNHDQIDLEDRSRNSMSAFCVEGVHVKEYSEITHTCIEGEQVLFIPFHNDLGQVTDYLANDFKGNPAETVVFGHLPIQGTIHHGTQKSEEGLNLSTFDPFLYTFMGHFHKHKVYGRKKNILYVGSPMQHSWNEAGDTNKGYVAYHTSTVRKFELCKNPFAERHINLDFQEAERLVNGAIPSRITDLGGKYVRLNLPRNSPGIPSEKEIRSVISLLETKAAHVMPVWPTTPIRVPAVNVAVDGEVIDGRVFDVQEALQTFLGSLEGEEHREREANDTLLSYIKRMQEEKFTAPEHRRTFLGRLAKLTMTGFLGVSEEMTLHFGTWPKGVFLMQGDNGAGKSTVKEALYWALYGQTFRGLEGDAVVHQFENPQGQFEQSPCCRVIVSFINGWKFTRERIKGKPHFTIVTPEGKRFKETSKKGTNEKLLSILNMDANEFSRVSILDKKQMVQMMKAAPREQTRLMSKTLGFGILDEYKTFLESDRKRISSEAQATAERLSEINNRSAADKELQRKLALNLSSADEELRLCEVRIKVLSVNEEALKAQCDMDGANLSLMKSEMIKACLRLDEEVDRVNEAKLELERCRSQASQVVSSQLRRLEDDAQGDLDACHLRETLLNEKYHDSLFRLEEIRNLCRQSSTACDLKRKVIEKVYEDIVNRDCLLSQRQKDAEDLSTVNGWLQSELEVQRRRLSEKSANDIRSKEFAVEECQCIESQKRSLAEQENMSRIYQSDHERLSRDIEYSEKTLAEITSSESRVKVLQDEHDAWFVRLAGERRNAVEEDGLSAVRNAEVASARECEIAQLEGQHERSVRIDACIRQPLRMFIAQHGKTLARIEVTRLKATLEELKNCGHQDASDVQSALESFRDSRRELQEKYEMDHTTIEDSLRAGEVLLQRCRQAQKDLNRRVGELSKQLQYSDSAIQRMRDRKAELEKGTATCAAKLEGLQTADLHRRAEIEMEFQALGLECEEREFARKAADDNVRDALDNLRQTQAEVAAVRNHLQDKSSLLAQVMTSKEYIHCQYILAQQTSELQDAEQSNCIALDNKRHTQQLVQEQQSIYDACREKMNSAITQSRVEEHTAVLTRSTILALNREIEEVSQKLETAAKDSALLATTLQAQRIQEKGLDFLSGNWESFRQSCLQNSAARVNERLQRNLQILCENLKGNGVGQHLSCRFDKTSLRLESDNGVPMTARSDGERARCELALSFAFFETAQVQAAFRPKLLFFDEVFDQLDEDGTEAIKKWLRGYVTEHPDVQILVVSHNTVPDALTGRVFSGRLDVTKRRGPRGGAHYEMKLNPSRR